MVTMLTALLLIAVVAGWAALEWVRSRRTRILTRTMAAIGAGDLSARSALRGHDRVAAIGAAIDAMAGDLQTRQAELERLTNVINRSPVVAIEWHNRPGWPVNFVSKSIEQWGYARDDLLNGSFVYADLIHPEDRPRIVDEVARHFAHGPDDYRQEYRLRTADGKWIWVDDRTWLTRDGAGTVVMIHGVLLDISKSKQAEEEVRALNGELEARVRARTAELRSTLRELEAFSYSVSHDLKAPLRGIDGYSQIVLEDYADRLDDEGRMLLGRIREGVTRMHDLIEDLLAYSRMERKPLDRRRLEPREVADAICALCAALPGGDRAVFTNSVPAGQLPADREGLTLVLRNLVENGIKFSRPGAPPEIELGGRWDPEQLLLWVRDNGIGFDMKYHDRMFEIFQRLQRAEDYPGTGVGLALVGKAMQRMGGKVWAESAPGEGACFYLSLPRMPQDESPPFGDLQKRE